jgi:hypothetical protein
MNIKLIQGTTRQLHSSSEALMTIAALFACGVQDGALLADKLDLEIERLRVTSILMRGTAEEQPRIPESTEAQV